MIRTILCPVDMSELSRRSVRLAGNLARRLGAGVVVHHNVEAAPPSPLGVAWMWSEDHEREAEAHVAKAYERLDELLAGLSGVEAQGKLSRGPLDEAVHEVAREVDADLLVIATHGSASPVHDSMTQRIVLRAPCAVLALGNACRHDQVETADWLVATDPFPVVVPSDFTGRSRRALAYALSLAEALPLSIHLIHVLGPQEADAPRAEERALDRLHSLIPDAIGQRISFHTAHGEPARGILDLARQTEARFVVMPAHSQGPLRRAVFGTTTLDMLRNSAVPVWFVASGAALGARLAQLLEHAVE